MPEPTAPTHDEQAIMLEKMAKRDRALHVLSDVAEFIQSDNRQDIKDAYTRIPEPIRERLRPLMDRDKPFFDTLGNFLGKLVNDSYGQEDYQDVVNMLQAERATIIDSRETGPMPRTRVMQSLEQTFCDALMSSPTQWEQIVIQNGFARAREDETLKV